MKRTQIQVPDPLYKEMKRLADLQDWSISEVFRRGAEELLRRYPDLKRKVKWTLPEPKDLGHPKIEEGRWRDVLAADESRVYKIP